MKVDLSLHMPSLEYLVQKLGFGLGAALQRAVSPFIPGMWRAKLFNFPCLSFG